LLVVLALALALRVGAAVGLQYQLDHVWHRQFLIEGDANGYWELGRKLAAGEAYSIYSPPRYVLRMPGFPALVALPMRIAGENFLFARFVMAAVGTAACALVYALGRQLFDKRIGLLAAALAAVSPTFVIFSVMVLSETLFAATLLVSLACYAKLLSLDFSTADRRRGVVWSLAAGAATALACYVRPSWLLAAPAFAVWIMLFSRGHRVQALFRGTFMLLALFAALTPWAIRNYRVTGHVVFTTLWLGPSLYDGLNPHATGDSDMTFYERDRLTGRLSEYEVDREYRRRAWQFVKADPGRTLELAFIKLVRYWNPLPNAQQFRAVAVAAPVCVFYLLLMLPAAWAAWHHRKQTWLWLLTAGPILYFAALHMVFVSSLRYRLPAEYPLWILAAAGLTGIVSGTDCRLSLRESGRFRGGKGDAAAH
jgi:4-amino-4-deoxy-L-arabinose transferase-like glycosyltransferase